MNSLVKIAFLVSLIFITRSTFAEEESTTRELWGITPKLILGLTGAIYEEAQPTVYDFPTRFLTFPLGVIEMTAAAPTFGVGSAIQGRYLKTGWAFTLLEASSVALFVDSAKTGCSGEVGGGCTVGILGLGALGVLETGDLFWGYHRARKREKNRVSVSVVPDSKKEFVLKLSYRF